MQETHVLAVKADYYLIEITSAEKSKREDTSESVFSLKKLLPASIQSLKDEFLIVTVSNSAKRITGVRKTATLENEQSSISMVST